MSYRNRLNHCKNKANRKQEPPDWHKIVAIGAEADAEIARLQGILREQGVFTPQTLPPEFVSEAPRRERDWHEIVGGPTQEGKP